MKAAAILIAAVALAACSPVVELGVGAAPNNGFEGSGPTFIGRLREDFGPGDRFWCEYQHVSRFAQGGPFNDEPEGTLDQVGCGVRLHLDPRKN